MECVIKSRFADEDAATIIDGFCRSHKTLNKVTSELVLLIARQPALTEYEHRGAVPESATVPLTHRRNHILATIQAIVDKSALPSGQKGLIDVAPFFRGPIEYNCPLPIVAIEIYATNNSDTPRLIVALSRDENIASHDILFDISILYDTDDNADNPDEWNKALALFSPQDIS